MALHVDKNTTIAVVGLGYVGLPLAVAFGNKFTTFGFDIKNHRVDELRVGFDNTGEVSETEILNADNLQFTCDISDVKECDVYVVCVPTPIDSKNQPDLSPLISATKLIAPMLTDQNTIIYESTVFPGATEEICVPILENISGLTYANDDNLARENVFYAGYSPERINPGDKQHRVYDIVKITSGSTAESASFIDSLYSKIIDAGTFKAKSIRIAEAAKVIENIQRDVNIALINEFAMLFRELNLDTEAVLQAAGTKWNFLPFKPGLVGGHCIGVDPYYLTHKAEQVGYLAEMILAGRRINNQMSKYACERILKLMNVQGISVSGSEVLVLGLSFKENCPDTRNSKVVDLVNGLADQGANITVFDPLVTLENVPLEMNGKFAQHIDENYFDCIVLAVGHSVFKKMGSETIRNFGKEKHVLFDLKYLFEKDASDERL